MFSNDVGKIHFIESAVVELMIYCPCTCHTNLNNGKAIANGPHHKVLCSVFSPDCLPGRGEIVV